MGYMSGRGVFVAVEERKKKLGRVRVIDAPYSYLVCGDKGEDLFHFLGDCLRLQNLRKDYFLVVLVKWMVILSNGIKILSV